jgi:hypothetical protein
MFLFLIITIIQNLNKLLELLKQILILFAEKFSSLLRVGSNLTNINWQECTKLITLLKLLA